MLVPLRTETSGRFPERPYPPEPPSFENTHSFERQARKRLIDWEKTENAIKGISFFLGSSWKAQTHSGRGSCDPMRPRLQLKMAVKLVSCIQVYQLADMKDARVRFIWRLVSRFQKAKTKKCPVG